MRQATEVIIVFNRPAFFTNPSTVVPIHINHEEDEPDMGSDEEEFVIENGNFHNDGIFSFGDAFVNPGIRDGLFVHRRHRGNSIFSTFEKHINPP